MTIFPNNKIDRRRFLALSIAAGLLPELSVRAKSTSVMVNDVHSGLNPTRVASIQTVHSTEEVLQALASAKKNNQSVSICGARHAAGGQQFLTDGVLLDTVELNKVSLLDKESGHLTVQSGIRWSALLSELETLQRKDKTPWGINQKQTGLNSLTVGGTLGCNAHGQGLLLKPFVGDIEKFTLITAAGDLIVCSRRENPDIFALAIGGYGLFGFVSDVTLKLVPRQKLRRKVQRIPLSELEKYFNASVDKGFRYGHCQINIDESSPRFLQEGLFAAYEPADMDSELNATTISQDQWQGIVDLVHVDKKQAFQHYVESIESTHDKVDWADSWQNNFYLNGYHQTVDANTHSKDKASEVLTEFYVPLNVMHEFLKRAGTYFLANGQNVIFSSVRFIEKDDETFIPWAKQRYACVVLNFHTPHTPEKIAETMKAWSHLIDLAIELNGNFYLTYQHVANKQQLLTCYPNFEKFLQAKLKHDPSEVFQSDWYQFHRKMFA